MRSVLLLNAAQPRAFDLTHLTWLDHLVVHTADISGPPSLHPDIPQRDGELVIRRQVVEEGLRLMRRLHMVETQYTDQGIVYSTTSEAGILVQLVRSPYGRELKKRAEWLIHYVMNADTSFLASIISDKIGRWTIEFHPSEGKAVR
jgi:hypothetical protein